MPFQKGNQLGKLHIGKHWKVKDTSNMHHSPWNKGKKCPQYSGENHPSWLGKEVKYSGVHEWVRRNLGKPDTCEHCGKSGLSSHQIQWANVDHEYDRDERYWVRLCAKCHREYDLVLR